MAVEDHPLFDAWSQALEEFKKAQDAYQTAVAHERRADWVEHMRLIAVQALKNFNRISDRIDNDA